MTARSYRVRIAIYDDIESTKEEPFVWTDEPLFSHPREIEHQAARTLNQHITKLASEQ